MQAFETVGWIVESEFWCAEHGQVDSEDEDHGYATPVFAGDEGADEHHCRACHTGPVYLDETTVQAVKTTPLPLGGQTRSGYGPRIPTTFMLRIDGRWRRVYCMQWSNLGTLYVIVAGERRLLGAYNPAVAVFDRIASA